MKSCIRHGSSAVICKLSAVRSKALARLSLAAIVAAVLAATGLARADDGSAAALDALQSGFRDPPASARPRVWWHWMNGNITQDGIRKDLEWMKRVGIGGVQNFDTALLTPQIVDRRLVYMSPEWKDAFRYAVRLAGQLGMEFAIASSPGFSETGGPWVKPEEAMKRIAWSEMTVEGDKPFKGQLPNPPSHAGLFQNAALVKTSEYTLAIPDFYRDVVVVAYRASSNPPTPRPTTATSNGIQIDASALFDDDLTTGIDTPARSAQQPGSLQYEFSKPQTVRSATLYMSGMSAYSATGSTKLVLEWSDDGRLWHKIAEVHPTLVPSTVSFDAISARYFRLLFMPGAPPAGASGFAPAPGADLSALSALGSMQTNTQILEFRLFADARVNAFEKKAGFAIADNYYELDSAAGEDTPGVPADSVIDLTSHMSADGTLEWTPPHGRWTVVRIGYSLTGTLNHPATAEATGLEVDKYDSTAVASYAKTYLQMYRQAADGLMGKQGLRALVTDSIEAGPSNWTPHLLEQFQHLRGYDARPWLPALTGVIVGSRSQSDAFLYDFRRTLADLIATEHYGTIVDVAHGQGLTVYGESLEGTRMTLGDDIEMRRFADIPMAALWTFTGTPRPANIADIRGAASVAHQYGRPLVAAESLTSMLAPWAFGPCDLQPMIDAEFAFGVNRPIIHTSVHQPVDHKVPGLSLMIFGQFFTRHETWAEMAKPWVDYIARNSYLLQQGRNVADVAYFYGEEEPIGHQASEHYPTDVPSRYAYDFLSPDTLINAISVDGGDVVSKGNARYKVIYLGGQSRHMTLPVLRRLSELADAGATIVGEAPESSPSLKDDTQEFAKLVQRLWNGAKITTVGKGRVIAGSDVEASLGSIGVTPDFTYAAAQADSTILFAHRHIDDGDIYFVDNRINRAVQLEAHFRVTAKVPRLWHADTGMTEPVSYHIEGGETTVPLELLPQQSVFVVFAEPASRTSMTIAPTTFTTIGEVRGSWDIVFQPARGAPAATQLKSLASLSDQSDPGIKYFSGIATYTKSFTPKGTKLGAPLLIDLGRIGDVAEVRMNGKLVGTAWKAPYRLDISSFVVTGRNKLEVRVANLWVNRLIGDAQPGAKKVTFTTFSTYTADAPLRPSGLIGPVTLIRPSRAILPFNTSGRLK